MISYFKLPIFVSLLIFSPVFAAFAIDFDRDGFADFVLVDVNESSQLEWYAIDINDSGRRSLGQFGEVGNHIAVGNWSGDANSSKAFISKSRSGEFEWSIDLAGGIKNLILGRYPASVISGLDIDKNTAIDPAVVLAGDKTLEWTLMSNPTLVSVPAVTQVNFGGKTSIPFYADIDGSGDQIATATLSKDGALIRRYKNITTGKVTTVSTGNFKSRPSMVLPVALADGRDVIFAISQQGTKIEITIISGRKKIKTLRVSGNEVVVGRYLSAASEVLAIRNGSNKAIFIDTKGGKSSLNIDLKGILVDDFNINSFKESKDSKPQPVPPTPISAPSNPVCSGTADSSQHLLYKPRSDTTGNAVLVFDSKYAREFRAVKIELKDGSFAEAWWKGLVLWGNPDSFGPRQHWRTNVRSSQIKDKALIVVDDGNQECRFVLPGSADRRWE